MFKQDLNEHSLQEYSLHKLEESLNSRADEYKENVQELQTPSLMLITTIADWQSIISKAVEKIYQNTKGIDQLINSLKGFLNVSQANGNSQPR